jgi:hypothetical protein
LALTRTVSRDFRPSFFRQTILLIKKLMPFSKRLCIHRDSVPEIIVRNIRLPGFQCDRESRFPRIQCDHGSGFSGLKETAEADFAKLSHIRGVDLWKTEGRKSRDTVP